MKKTMFTSPNKNQKKHKQGWWLLCWCMNMQKEKHINQWEQSKTNSKEMMKVHRAHKPHKKDAKNKHGNIWGQKRMKETRKKIFPILYTCDGYVIRPLWEFQPFHSTYWLHDEIWNDRPSKRLKFLKRFRSKPFTYT